MSTRVLVTLFAIPLLVLAGCSREKSDWRSAQAADTQESYEHFIGAHPDSSLVTKARERLGQLAEEKDWRSAAEADTAEAYRQFLSQYPTGKWAKEAQVRVDNFAGAAGANSAVPAPAAAPMATPGEAAAPAIAAAASPTASGYGVQLGAFSSADRANAEWNKIKRESSGTLDGLEPRVVVGEAGGKTIYRLQAEVRDEAQARAVCTGLTLDKTPCVPVLPPKTP
jgi:D-alanyl-D-alanine carboxypeptidase